MKAIVFFTNNVLYKQQYRWCFLFDYLAVFTLPLHKVIPGIIGEVFIHSAIAPNWQVSRIS